MSETSVSLENCNYCLEKLQQGQMKFAASNVAELDHPSQQTIFPSSENKCRFQLFILETVRRAGSSQTVTGLPGSHDVGGEVVFAIIPDVVIITPTMLVFSGTGADACAVTASTEQALRHDITSNNQQK